MHRGRPGSAVSIAGHIVVFAVLLAPWWLHASDAISSGNGTRDNRLIPWVLAWVAHALSTGGANVFDAPIYFPSPRMLTGSEHFFSLQVLFAPLYRLTGNPVLSANVIALLSYPAAAIAMDRLLRACGLPLGAAWFGGFAFALGPMRVPSSVQPLQFMNLFLPLVALASMRLRQAFGWRRLAGCGVVFAVGIFSSYYLAANLVVLAAAYGLLEAFRPAPGRMRFASAWAIMVAITLVVLAIVSRPYFERRDDLLRESTRSATPVPTPTPSAVSGRDAWKHVGHFALLWAGVVPTCLAVGGIPGIAARSPEIRRVSRIGLGIGVGGVVLALRAHETLLPEPIRTALGFLRFSWRFLLLYGFGVSLLAASALAAVRSAGLRAYRLLIAIAVAATCWLQGTSLVSLPLDHVAGVSIDAAVYQRVRDATRVGGGSLLELPLVDAHGRDLQADAMIGATVHWRPLIDGYTGYEPAYRDLLRERISRLPAPDALDEIVDMTHLRWLLVRPERDWPSGRRQELLLGLARIPDLGPSFAIEGWTLQRVDRVPRHPEWFAALSTRTRRDATWLGTPLTALRNGLRAHVSVAGSDPPRRARAGWILPLPLVIANMGAAGWPVLVADASHASFTVHLEAEWRPAAAPAADERLVVDIPLERDLPAGETLSQTVIVPTPQKAGEYALFLRVRQRGTDDPPDDTTDALRLDLSVGAP